MFFQRIIVATSLLAIAVATEAPAELAPVQQLQKRNPYYGGYGLRQGSANCPKDTQTCDSGFCCPANTWCSENIGGPYCCPTSEDCGAAVGDGPTCADPSWTLYNDAYAFCCLNNQVGIQGEQCQPTSLTFSATLYAATGTQANTALPPTTRSGATTTAAGTVSTAASSTTGGGIGGLLTSVAAAATSAIGKSGAGTNLGDPRSSATTVTSLSGWLAALFYALL